MQSWGAGASHNACLHIDSLSLDDAIVRLTVYEMLRLVFFKCIARLCFYSAFFIMQPWFYPVVKYCFNAISFTRFIFVNSVIISSIISCNDLYQDFIIMYIWYFVSWNSISVPGAIWPSLSPCTAINPILLTYLLTHNMKNVISNASYLDVILI